MSTTLTQRRIAQDPQIALKEKLRLHYQNRDFTVKPEHASYYGAAFTAFMNLSLALEAIFWILPEVYKTKEDGTASVGWNGEGYWLMFIVTLFLWVEITWNWWRAYYDVPNWVRKETKAIYFGQMLETPPGIVIL